MEKLFLRTPIVHYRCLRQVHDCNHTGQMMGKQASVLSSNGTCHQIASSLGCGQTTIDFVQAAIEMIIKQIARKIAVFEATVEDQTMARLPTDWIIRPSKSNASHDIVGNVNQSRSRWLQSS